MKMKTNTEKTRSALLGVPKNTTKIGGLNRMRKKRGLLKRVVKYLKSDTYMFAPLAKSRPPPSDLVSPIIKSFPDTVEMREPMEGKKKKKLVKKIVDYLKSDSYMYSAMCVPQATSCRSIGPIHYAERVTMEISRRVLTVKGNQMALESENRIEEDHIFDGLIPVNSVSGPETLAHNEALRNKNYANCRSSSVTEKRMLDSPLRKLVID